MGDGHLNKCKECAKKDVDKREKEKRKDPEWVERERVRSIEKYHRLGYKDKQVEWNKKRPWTQNSVYKSLHNTLKCKKGNTLHHWCYKEESLKDVFEMRAEDHKKIHRFLIIDNDELKFRTINGVLLDTKEKHWEYWLSVKNLD